MNYPLQIYIQLKEYEMVTNMLEAKTGLKDLAEILDLYQNHEERNETLYKKLQELNDEKEQLETELADVQKEINALAKPQKKKLTEARDIAMQDLKVRRRGEI